MVVRDHDTSLRLARRPVCGFLTVLCGGLALGVLSAGDALFAAAPSSAVEESVQAALESGEFGPALDQALTVADPQQKTRLLKQIARAQAEAGETFAATATLRRIPNVRERATAVSRQQTLAGGAAMANPGPLMELIQQNTSGEWEAGEGVGGNMSWFPTGVKVSPGGVLERITAKEQTKTLAALGIRARKADLNSNLARPSALRLVSLTRLDRELDELLAAGRPVPASMALLAGLTKVQYVFVFPEEGEIVLGGPAEGWEYNAQGQPVGTESKRPTVQLDDFVTVYRTFARGETDFGCSINTRDENVRSLQQFVAASQARGPLSAGAGVRNFVNQIQQKLGRQDIVVWGVPADSRVARVIVEADYRMKLIGIDKLDAGKDVPSYFDLLPHDLQKNPAPMEALRWWLTMKYDAILHNAEKTVFEFQGPSVLCQSENQLLTAEGKHVPTGKSEGVNRVFAENFTRNYDKLAERDPVFADARNVFDLALAASLICREGLVEQAGGAFQVFSVDGLYRPTSYHVPKEVESVVNHRVYNGRDVVVQAAGGVRADANDVSGRQTPSTQLDQVAETTRRPDLPAGRWWWDASR
jgi:hypothetical protein